MIVTPLENGIVLDHIKPGKGIELYNILKLYELDSNVALILNANSVKMGKKDIIKIAELIDLDLDILGYIDPGITVSVVRDGKVSERKKLSLPQKVVGVIKCKNPRCITSVEQELVHMFKLTDREKGIYRCMYCETKAK
ncbi:MAG: aspartate carbamoyltransferase regulatory subunit [Clostridia bacterium]|nr:aspartate carbamoyltransferase regulatory subunit [Clostridia bacterium]